MITKQTRAYFSSLVSLLQSTTSAEQLESIATGAWHEIEGNELVYCTDKFCSFTIEQLVSYWNSHQLSDLLKAMNSADIGDIVCHPSSSRVLEGLLVRITPEMEIFLPGNSEKYNPVPSEELDNAFLTLSVALSTIWADVIVDPYGSHVMRKIIMVLGCSKRPALSSALEKVLNDVIENLGDELLQQLSFHQQASPVLQYILEAASTQENLLDPILQRLAQPLLISSTENLNEMLLDTVASHLAEKIVQLAPDLLYMKIYSASFRHNMCALSDHFTGNHVVQRLITSVRQPSQLSLFCKELDHHLPKLLSLGHSGVILSLSEACEKFLSESSGCQLTLLKSLEQGLRELFSKNYPKYDSNAYNFISMLLWPHELVAQSQKTTVVQQIPFVNSKIVQSLLSFTPQNSGIIFKSLISLDKNVLLGIACNPIGSHIISKAILVHGRGVDMNLRKLKEKFLSGLFGASSPSSLEILCSCKDGARIVEQAYRQYDVSGKTNLAKNLVGIQDKLNTTPFGRSVFSHCRVKEYSQSNKQWEDKAQRVDKTRRSFSDIVDGSSGTQDTSKRRKTGKRKASKFQKIADSSNTTEKLPTVPETPETASSNTEKPHEGDDLTEVFRALQNSKKDTNEEESMKKKKKKKKPKTKQKKKNKGASFFYSFLLDQYIINDYIVEQNE